MGSRSVYCWVLTLVLAAFGGSASAGDGVVAVQSADASCANDSSNRYVNCENGTITDNRSGLVWLANANCLGDLNWFEAMEAVRGLSDLPDEGSACFGLSRDECDCALSDGSSPGEWRLPSIAEWEAMVEPTCSDPALSDDEGSGCWNSPCDPGSTCSFYRVQSSSNYWSASSDLTSTNVFNVWVAFMGSGDVLSVPKTGALFVWPVRGGQ